MQDVVTFSTRSSSSQAGLQASPSSPANGSHGIHEIPCTINRYSQALCLRKGVEGQQRGTDTLTKASECRKGRCDSFPTPACISDWPPNPPSETTAAHNSFTKVFDSNTLCLHTTISHRSPHPSHLQTRRRPLQPCAARLAYTIQVCHKRSTRKGVRLTLFRMQSMNICCDCHAVHHHACLRSPKSWNVHILQECSVSRAALDAHHG